MADTKTLGEEYEEATLEAARKRLNYVMLKRDATEAERQWEEANRRAKKAFDDLCAARGVVPPVTR